MGPDGADNSTPAVLAQTVLSDYLDTIRKGKDMGTQDRVDLTITYVGESGVQRTQHYITGFDYSDLERLVLWHLTRGGAEVRIRAAVTT